MVRHLGQAETDYDMVLLETTMNEPADYEGVRARVARWLQDERKLHGRSPIMQIANKAWQGVQILLCPYILIVWFMACTVATAASLIWEGRWLILSICFVLGIFKLLGI